jgi:hypothetical protein
MLAYKSIEEVQHENTKEQQSQSYLHNNNRRKQNDSGSTTLDIQLNSLPPLHHQLIEKSIKTYKTHCNARDFDSKFVASLGLNNEEVTFVKAVVSRMKASE